MKDASGPAQDATEDQRDAKRLKSQCRKLEMYWQLAQEKIVGSNGIPDVVCDFADFVDDTIQRLIRIDKTARKALQKSK